MSNNGNMFAFSPDLWLLGQRLTFWPKVPPEGIQNKRLDPDHTQLLPSSWMLLGLRPWKQWHYFGTHWTQQKFLTAFKYRLTEGNAHIGSREGLVRFSSFYQVTHSVWVNISLELDIYHFPLKWTERRHLNGDKWHSVPLRLWGIKPCVFNNKSKPLNGDGHVV